MWVVRYPPKWINISQLNLFETAIYFAHSNDQYKVDVKSEKSMQSVKWSLLHKGRCPKINLGTPTVFEIYKIQKSLWTCLGMPDYPHLKLHDQFVALIDMKLHTQNQLYTSLSF